MKLDAVKTKVLHFHQSFKISVLMTRFLFRKKIRSSFRQVLQWQKAKRELDLVITIDFATNRPLIQ